MHEVSEAVSSPARLVYKRLVTGKLRVNAESSVARELLELAIENEELTIFKLEFVNEVGREVSNDTLEQLATAADDRDILRLLRRKDSQRILEEEELPHLKSH